MKFRSLRKALSFLLSASIVCGIVLPAYASNEVYDYPNKELWYDSSYFGGYMTYRDLVARNGSTGFDVDALINSELGESILNRMKGTFLYSLPPAGDPDHEKTTQLWAEKGVDKQLKTIVNDSIPEGLEYSVFAPTAALENNNGARMPLVFVWHGGGRNIMDAEFYGFVDMCVDENLIVVCPSYQTAMADDENLSYSTIVHELLTQLEKDGYPVDYSRIYSGGHSACGRASINVALENPELFAAIAPMGSACFGLTDEANVYGDLAVPMYMLMGEYDYGQLPMTQPVEGAMVEWDPADLIDNINKWLSMNDCATQLTMNSCIEQMKTSKVCNMLGIYGDIEFTRVIDGTVNYVADYVNRDGVVSVRFEAVSNLPHWMHGSYAEMAWEFMSQFTRGTDGSSIYSGDTAAGFKDVPVGSWYSNAVKYVKDNNIMNGTGDGHFFSPAMSLNRAMLMTILARLDGANTEGGDTWYSKGLEWAVANGISDGTNPSRDITRQEMVTMLYRYCGSPSVSGNLSGYPDGDTTSTWAGNAVIWAVQNGLLTGGDGNKLTPQGVASRMEVATILMRFCENVLN